ncbi:MAG: NifU family protein [Acidimicrobiia bacterium]|jgi:Fe/S biogenesis protein NfuA
MSDTQTPVIDITEEALATILELRESEAIDDLHLALRISGVGANGYVYETAFLRPEDVTAADHVERHDGLPVAIAEGSVDDLRGAVLDLSTSGPSAGLVIRNPNTPSPGLGLGDDIELTGTTEEKVRQLLTEQINPAIASHGGIANLIGVDGTRAMLELGGGCQGCGLAAVTLQQGIEKAILSAVPEITEVVDVTDHSLGANPYF